MASPIWFGNDTDYSHSLSGPGALQGNIWGWKHRDGSAVPFTLRGELGAGAVAERRRVSLNGKLVDPQDASVQQRGPKPGELLYVEKVGL